MIVSMELEGHLPLDLLDHKIKQIGDMRQHLAHDLEELNSFYATRTLLSSNLRNLSHSLNELAHNSSWKERIVDELAKYHREMAAIVDNVRKAYEQTMEEMKSQFSRQMCEKDNQLDKQYLITKSLKEELSKLRHTATPNTREPQDLHKKSSKSLFRPQRMSLELPPKVAGQITPIKLVKTSVNSPEKFEEISFEKESLWDISPPSIKKENDSLFRQLDIKSKRKEFNVDIPFEAEFSRVEESIENTENVFAKLTFGKDKVRLAKASLSSNYSVLKSNVSITNTASNTHQNKISWKRLEQLSGSYFPSEKRLSVNLEMERKKADCKDNVRNQEIRYTQLVKSVIEKENFLKHKKPGFYVGDKAKEIKYQGMRRDGKKFGRGVVYYSDGLVYDGEFKNNCREGFGTLKFEHTEVYSGDWENDMIQGEGRLKNCPLIRKNGEPKANPFSSWLNYTGILKDNAFCGPGTLQLPRGQKFIGEFVNGRVEGEGTHYKSNGEMVFGIWRNNKLVEEI